MDAALLRATIADGARAGPARERLVLQQRIEEREFFMRALHSHADKTANRAAHA